jgi:uncharacterized protein (TIGR00159 family)
VLEGLSHLFSARPLAEVLRDIFDIFIVTFLIYRALVVLKGTRAMQMGIGLVAFGFLYVVAKYAELTTVMSLLSWLASSAILIIVVVFQNDIRRALIRLGAKAWLSRGRDAQERVIEEVVAAATELARHRMGAIICLERDANVLEFVKSDGVDLDCEVSRELLVSLFLPEAVNKLHDGAVLIRDLRIAKAGVFLPMPEVTKVADTSLGSRHRAAIGITEETDAVVVVVSEERGTITLCFPNGMVQNVDGNSLKQALLGLFGRSVRKEQTLAERIGIKRPDKPAAKPPAKPPAKTSGQYTAVERPPLSVPRPEAASRAASERPDEEEREPASRLSITKPMEPTELFTPIDDESSKGLDDTTNDDEANVTVGPSGPAARDES